MQYQQNESDDEQLDMDPNQFPQGNSFNQRDEPFDQDYQNFNPNDMQRFQQDGKNNNLR
jgi:hypothetical protein